MTVFEKSKFQIDFDEMESKCHANHYRIAEEFRADAQLVVHNTVIFHGGKNNNRFKAKIFSVLCLSVLWNRLERGV